MSFLSIFRNDQQPRKPISWVNELTTRERVVLVSGISLVFCFVLFQFILIPFFDSRSLLKDTILKKQADFAQISALQQHYANLKVNDGAIQKHLANREKHFSLFTFLDTQSKQAGIKDRVSYMKPSQLQNEGRYSESLVEMKIEGIGLDRLVTFLSLIESKEKVIFVNRLSVQQASSKKGYLDVLLQATTFRNES